MPCRRNCFGLHPTAAPRTAPINAITAARQRALSGRHASDHDAGASGTIAIADDVVADAALTIYAGELRPDFDPDAMAMAIRASIDAATRRVIDPTFDIDQYANEIATLFHLATRLTEY